MVDPMNPRFTVFSTPARERSTGLLILVAGLLVLILLAGACGGNNQQEEEKRNFYGPTEIALQPYPLLESGPLLFAVNSWGGNLSILNTESYEIIKGYISDRWEEKALWVGPAPQDIAMTPSGDLVYVTDANREAVRIGITIEPWTIDQIDLVLERARVSIVPALIDPDDLTTTIPPAWEERGEVWFADPPNSRLVVWSHFENRLDGQVELPSPPVDLQVSRDGDAVFVIGEDTALRVVDAVTRRLEDVEVFVGGLPTRVVESPAGDEVYVLNSNPPQLHIIDARTWRQDDLEITFQAALNDMAFSTDGDFGFITSDDGFLYWFYRELRRVCGSWYDKPYFYDFGPIANPTLVNIETEDCRTHEEEWKITYRQREDDWEVEGSKSGLQINLAYTGQSYISDQGEIKFLIRAGDYHESDGDAFRIWTRVGKEPVPMGALPRGIAISPIIDELGEDKVFVADPSTNSVTRIITDDTENYNTIE